MLSPEYLDSVEFNDVVDLYNKLIDDDGNLNISYTKDGLHISSEGYECITKELMKYIKD